MEKLLTFFVYLGLAPLMLACALTEVAVRSWASSSVDDEKFARASRLANLRFRVAVYWSAPLLALVVVLALFWFLGLAMGGSS